MKWLWTNTTKVGFGSNVVQEHLKDFVTKKSRILCTFGGGSIEKNRARSDVEKALSELECEVKWEGGIQPNPRYVKCLEIIKIVREYKPDLILAVGGGSVIDATKFIAAAACLDEFVVPWDIISKGAYAKTAVPFGTVLTIPATGSEWNNGYAIQRDDIQEKNNSGSQLVYPQFSLIDPRYTMTLPARQLRNGLFDAMMHCTDQVITSESAPMSDNFYYSIMRELVDISDGLMKPNSSLELHERLITAASFAQNHIFTYAKRPNWECHLVAQPLTPMYGIDHAATLSIVAPVLYEKVKKGRIQTMARAAERVFDVRSGTDEEKADKFVESLRNWAVKLGMPLKVSDCEYATKINPGDVQILTQKVKDLTHSFPYRFNDELTETVVEEIFNEVDK